MTTATARGIRNNNPGNIRRSGVVWLGQSSVQLDKDFVTFDTPLAGARALSRLLKTYYHNHGLKTVNQIISRYAPSIENDTSSYVKSVAKRLAIHPDMAMVSDDFTKKLPKLVQAIIVHENGIAAIAIYNSELIDSAIKSV